MTDHSHRRCTILHRHHQQSPPHHHLLRRRQLMVCPSIASCSMISSRVDRAVLRVFNASRMYPARISPCRISRWMSPSNVRTWVAKVSHRYHHRLWHHVLHPPMLVVTSAPTTYTVFLPPSSCAHPFFIMINNVPTNCSTLNVLPSYIILLLLWSYCNGVLDIMNEKSNSKMQSIMHTNTSMHMHIMHLKLLFNEVYCVVAMIIIPMASFLS